MKGMLPSGLEKELLRPGEVTVLAGPHGQGKTSLALQLALSAVGRKDAAAIFSLKTEKSRLLKRCLCLETGIPLAAGRPPLHIFDTVASVKEILRLSQALSRKAKGKLGLVVVDYVELVSEMQDDGAAQAARTLRGLARELDVPVLLLSLGKRRGDTVGTVQRDIKKVLLKVSRRGSGRRKIRLSFDRINGRLFKP